MFIRFDRMYERDRHTDTHTPQDGIASRGKNETKQCTQHADLRSLRQHSLDCVLWHFWFRNVDFGGVYFVILSLLV